MEGLLERITQVQERELGAKEFQMVVLQTLLELLREQERLSSTVKALQTERRVEDSVVGRMRDDMEALLSEDSSEEEQEDHHGSPTKFNGVGERKEEVKILYYHETRQREEGGEDTEEADEDAVEEETDRAEYRWKRRIPASRFGDIVKEEGKRKHDKSFTDQILTFDGSGDSEAANYGRKHEKDAIHKLEQILGQDISPPKKFIDKEHKFLVCVPDGLLGEDKLVEIKCPYKCSSTSMELLAKEDQHFCLKVTETGRLKLKEDHPYYYQVQGELRICQKNVCYFVVWSPKEFHYQVIEKDDHFWDVKMFPWLLDFHRMNLLEDKWNIPDLPDSEVKKRSNEVLRRLQTSRNRQAVIERATRGQGKNPEWRKERRERLTASNFGRVAKMRPTTSCQNTVVSILYPDRLDNMQAIKYGKENEACAISELNTILDREGLPQVEECGLFVDIWKGFLAASPDGMVGKDGLVEVKCPLRCADLSALELARKDSSFCLKEVEEGVLRLKKNHNYYYQIQGQLHIASRSVCYFMVWSPRGSHMEVIEYDADFWEDLEEILENFYRNCLLPEIVDPRAPRGLPLREPEYIIQAQSLKNMKI